MRAARTLTLDSTVIEDVPEPVCGPGEVVCRVIACATCGSDVHGWYVGLSPRDVLLVWWIATRSPLATLSTPAPTSTTSPTGSWPSTAGSLRVTYAAALAPGGRLCVYAPPEPGAPVAVDGAEIFLRELTVTSSWSAGAADMRAALALLRAGALPAEELITHRFPLDDSGAALAAQRDGSALKAVVLPWGDAAPTRRASTSSA